MNMVYRTYTIASLVLVLFLSGCASTPKQAFNKAAHSDLKNIVVLVPDSIQEYEIRNLGHPGASFGLIGALIATAETSGKTTEFTQLMADRELKGSDEYLAALTAALEAAGYEVTVQSVARKQAGFLSSYRDLPKNAGAYLDSALSFGYLCASSDSPYLPRVSSRVRLIKQSSGEVIYDDEIVYGFENRYASAVSIASDPKYNFNEFADLKGAPDLAMEGMRVGIPLVVKRIAQDLARQ